MKDIYLNLEHLHQNKIKLFIILFYLIIHHYCLYYNTNILIFYQVYLQIFYLLIILLLIFINIKLIDSVINQHISKYFIFL